LVESRIRPADAAATVDDAAVTMRDHLRGIAAQAATLSGKIDANVLDIGCNDGTLLANYPETFTKFGVDPSDVAVSVKTEFKLVQDVFPSSELLNVLGTQSSISSLHCHVL